MKLRTIALVLTLALASAVAHAQSGVFVLGTSQQFTQEGVNTYITHPGSQNIDRPWLFGASYGVYYDVTRLPYLGQLKTGPVVFGIDARGETLRDSENYGSFNEQNGIFSVRVATKNKVKQVVPYLRGGFGIGHTRVPGRLSYSNNFIYQFGGGLDYNVHKHIDWRVVEFSMGFLGSYATGYYPAGVGPNQSNYMLTLGTGLVFHAH